jgi:hypothetical protein
VRSRFRPRYVGLAVLASATGAAGVALGALALSGGAAGLVIVLGALGVAIAPAYLMAPAWRLVVEVEGDALVVRGPRGERLRLRWAEVAQIVWAPRGPAMFVDGGVPARSLLVPGPGAPAPYDLEDKAALCAAILARVPPDRVVEVESLERAAAQ